MSNPKSYGSYSYKSSKLPDLSRSSRQPQTMNRMNVPDRSEFVRQAKETMAKASRRSSVRVPAVLNSLSPSIKTEKSRLYYPNRDSSPTTNQYKQAPKDYPNKSTAFSNHPHVQNLARSLVSRRPSKLGNPFDDDLQPTTHSRRGLKPY